MKPISAFSTIVTVTLTALFGMVLGAIFGLVAGAVAPDIFEKLVRWETYEPRGTAIVLGGFGGILCGGALGAFAVLVQAIAQGRASTRTPETRKEQSVTPG